MTKQNNICHNNYSIEISVLWFESHKHKGGNAMQGVFLFLSIIGQVKCGDFESTSNLCGWSFNPFYLPFLFESNRVENNTQRSFIMQNIINFPTKRIYRYRSSHQREINLLKTTLNTLERIYQKQQRFRPLEVYKLACEVAQEVRYE